MLLYQFLASLKKPIFFKVACLICSTMALYLSCGIGNAVNFSDGVSAFECGDFRVATKIMARLVGKRNTKESLAAQAYILAMDQVTNRSGIGANLLAHINQCQRLSNSNSEKQFYQTILGKLHLTNMIDQSNPQKGLQLLQAAHANNYGYATYLLGQYHEGRLGVHASPSLKHAAQKYKRAACKFHFQLATEALRILNAKNKDTSDLTEQRLIAKHFMLLTTLGTSDYRGRQSESMLRSKSHQGDKLATGFLILYFNSSKRSEDQVKALSLWTDELKNSLLEVAQNEQKCSYINYIIGRLYQDGFGTFLKNNQMAFYYLKKSEHLKYPPALYALADCYIRGEEKEPKALQAVGLIKQSADLGYAPAQCLLAWMCFLGIRGVAKNELYAMQWYEKAGVQGYSDAQYWLGYIYGEGFGVAENKTKALIWFKRAAKHGHVRAQYQVGRMYEAGQGVIRNTTQAVTWYKKAAKQGYVPAQNDLGLMYATGCGVMKDITQAITYLTAASEWNYTEAQYQLGQMYEFGQGVVFNIRHAAILYKKAAEWGHAKAQYQLGWLYLRGRGVSQDSTQATVWFEKAAKQGYAKAQYQLGWMYEAGQGVVQNLEKAATCHKEAAECGHMQAQYQLGWRYAKGLGVVQDDAQAAVWFKEAAKQGHIKAQYQLGWRHAKGLGIVQDDTQALVWYKKAATSGHMQAQYHLGEMYAVGLGVSQNYRQALEWFRKSADSGHAKAQYWIGYMYTEGYGVVQDDKQAVLWFETAAKQGHLQAQCQLGYMYAKGHGIVQDNTKSMAWLTEAAQRGHAKAQCWLAHMYSIGCDGVARNETQAMVLYRKAAAQKDSEAEWFLKNGCAKNSKVWYRKMFWGKVKKRLAL